MSVVRVHKTKDFTVMSNFHFREKNMSLKAKGLLSLMLSLPEEWDYSINGLVALSSDGETAVRTALKELEEFGYLEREQVRENGKIVDWNYNIYETPQKNSLDVENQQLGNVVVDKQGQLNTKELSTKEKRTKLNNFGKRPATKENLYDKCFKEIMSFASKDVILQNVLIEYLRVWITLKDKHPSYEGWKRILKKLAAEFIEDDWDAVIRQSIQKRYATFCPVSNYEKRPAKKFDENINRDGRYDKVSHTKVNKVF